MIARTMNSHPSDLLPMNQEGAGLILTPCPGTKGVDTATSLSLAVHREHLTRVAVHGSSTR